MSDPDLPAQLRQLEAAIRRKGLSKEAFDRWSAVSDRLSERHRLRLLVAWSRALISGQAEPFAEKVEQVIAEIEANGADR